jgi:hypothetical protein
MTTAVEYRAKSARLLAQAADELDPLAAASRRMLAAAFEIVATKADLADERGEGDDVQRSGKAGRTTPITR